MNFRWLLKKSTATEEQPIAQDPIELSGNLHENLEWLKNTFSYPENKALTLREIYIPYFKQDGTLLYLDGATDRKSVEQHILEPLISQANIAEEPSEDSSLVSLLKKVLTSASGSIITERKKILNNLLQGSTILLVDGQACALSVDTAGFETRSISEPTNENVIKGPKEAFVESAAINRSLIRKQIKDYRLMTESVFIGEKTLKEIDVVYLKGVANPELVKEVKQRLQGINSDLVQSLSILEQFVELRSYSMIPSALLTERPDRACSFIHEGHIVLLMDNDPLAMVVPITFFSLFQTSEDMHLRWAYGNFIRLIRLFAMIVALLTPSIYIAISTFHEEMLPTDLLLAIAATRERVPFPALVEVLIMETTFELVREAGIRIPKTIGPTIGIVGALILGQAAVEANIISPILVIVVALTGLSSFAIPEISFNFTVRITRFFILLAASFMGFYGIAIALTFILAYLASFESFGVPFFSPLAPHYRSSKDLVFRPPVKKQWLRPFNLRTRDKVRNNKPEGT
jgi:spore germination protein KA